MVGILGDLIRGAMAHSECVALFAILLLQQWAMHAVNTRHIDKASRKVDRVMDEIAQTRKENGASRG